MSPWISAFIVIAAVAIVVQMAILLALFVATQKSRARLESLASEVHGKAVPMLDAAHGLLVENRPKIETIIGNTLEISEKARNQVERLDATVTDIVDRTRLQVIRADELVGRTMDRVEETTEIVHHSVISPVRQIAGLVQGLTTGFDVLFRRKGGNKAREGAGRRAAQDEELFI